jgi:hypothetical protein
MGWTELSREEFFDLGGQLDENQLEGSTTKRDDFDESIRQELLRALKSGEARFRVKVEIVKK